MPAMDRLKTALFEDPIYVYVALVVAFLALAAVWYERRTRRAALLLLAPPVLAAVVFALEALVVTDREQIVAAAKDIAASVEAGDFGGILKHLDEDFTASLQGATIRKTDVQHIVAQQAAVHRITRVAFSKTVVEVGSDEAAMHVVTIITWSAGRSPLVWDVLWVKTAQGWRIRHVAEPQQRMEL